jgi:hypothetical protein
VLEPTQEACPLWTLKRHRPISHELLKFCNALGKAKYALLHSSHLSECARSSIVVDELWDSAIILFDLLICQDNAIRPTKQNLENTGGHSANCQHCMQVPSPQCKACDDRNAPLDQMNPVHTIAPRFLCNSVASVHKRTIPTERPPLVSEVSANFFL